MHKHTIRRLSLLLRLVAHSRSRGAAERDRATGVEVHAHVAARIDLLNRPEFSVRDVALAVRRRELD